MKAIQALEYFQNLIENSGYSINQLTPETTVKLMLEFYVQNRAEDCDLSKDSDMLLFQWGTYNWGSGESFTYNITRQFIFPEMFQENNSVWQEDVFWQLRLSLMFDVVNELRLLKSGSKWCESPSVINNFQNFIFNCDATVQIKHYHVKSVELIFGKV